ncbi:MAG TPA: hypothetical protein PLB50_06025, partial [Candidatus Saccharicenans sp.]|nr:hypothetical protein [Candidatus Saccharicenans sp.]
MKLTRMTPASLKNKTQLVFMAALLCLGLGSLYSLPLSAAVQTEDKAEVIAIVGAKIVPVTGQIIDSGSILIKDGRIVDLGANVSIPAGARVIEARGLTAYPGMIDSYSWLGLEEIS